MNNGKGHKIEKVGKTTRPFRYDLNQIPYDYTVEVRNRFKGVELIERVLDELVVFPTFFNLSLNLAIRSSWSEPQSAPALVLLTV